jgi:2,3-bisphosphoglycerate-dependent phosphoglycerate mutase
VDLSTKGREAAEARRILRKTALHFDIAYTSVLKRAIRTLWIVLDEMDRMWIPVQKCWQLNERHYGSLQGLNKAEVGAKFGQEQVELWRRSYTVRPPKLEPEDERYPHHDSRYRQLRPDQLPLSESLKDTASRLWPCWQHSIAPALHQNQAVLVVAHGNSMRALVKYLDNISDADIAKLELPAGVPLMYEFDTYLNPISRHHLAPQSLVAQADLDAAGGSSHDGLQIA